MFLIPSRQSVWPAGLVLIGFLSLLTGCRPAAMATAGPAPTATPRPWDVPPPGATLTPYTVQRIVLDTLPFPANTLALANLTSVYNGDGTWTVQTVIGERVPDPASTPLGQERRIEYTRFVWTVSDLDRSILALNPEGQEWLSRQWAPWP